MATKRRRRRSSSSVSAIRKDPGIMRAETSLGRARTARQKADAIVDLIYAHDRMIKEEVAMEQGGKKRRRRKSKSAASHAALPGRTASGRFKKVR